MYKSPPQLCLPPKPSHPASASLFIPQKHRLIYEDDCDPASAIEAAFASATLLTSPCFPFCSPKLVSESFPEALSHPIVNSTRTYVPLGESQLHFSSSLCCQSLFILQASSNDSCGDREVFVVAVGWRILVKVLNGMCSIERRGNWLGGTYVRPDAFHANAIV